MIKGASFIFSVSVFLSSCTNVDSGVDSSGNGTCEKYLHDTGFSVIEDKNEIDELIKLNELKLNEENFCFGKKKVGAKFCYLALPREDSFDGEYTNFPVY